MNGDARLPSDMEFRPDIVPMINKDWKRAEDIKLLLEQ